MKIEIFEKATELQRNIKNLTHIIDDVEKKHHWISLVSACYENEVFSKDFYKSLLEFAKTKLEEYKKEFNELQDSDVAIIDSDSNWISVDDKLPKDGEYVLIQDYDDEIYMAWLNDNEWEGNDEWVVVSGIYDRFEFEEIPYWHPLPEPKQQERI